MCNYSIEVEDNFPLESIAACLGKQSALTMYYTVNTAFMHYFDTLTDDLETEEQVLPISLQTFEFDSKLLKPPKTPRDLVNQYKQEKKQILNKRQNNNNKHSFFNNLITDVFLFIAAILSMIATAAIIHIVCKHEKLKQALLSSL